MSVGLYHQLRTANTFTNLIFFIQIHVCAKTPVKKDLMKIVLFKNNECLKLYRILCILHILIIFGIYKTIRSFPKK